MSALPSPSPVSVDDRQSKRMGALDYSKVTKLAAALICREVRFTGQLCGRTHVVLDPMRPQRRSAVTLLTGSRSHHGLHEASDTSHDKIIMAHSGKAVLLLAVMITLSCARHDNVIMRRFFFSARA